MELQNQGTGTNAGNLSRRGFLRAGGTLAAGVVLAACGAPSGEITVAEMAQPARAPILPSPVPAAGAAAVEGPLAQFLALSRVLTGYDNLNPQLGQVYLDSIAQSSDYGITVEALIQAAGVSGESDTTVADLEAAGLFNEPESQKLADAILTMWYTGIYTTADGEQQVATYADALMWRALTFTKPPTICGSPGFWAQAPQQPFACTCAAVA